LPDVTYHELAYPFISNRVNFDNYGQAGALLQSFADVLTALIKQKRGGIPEDESWLIAPGAGAWLTGQDIKGTSPQVPLRSMKAPGQAFRNHPILGNDPQPAHFRDLYTGKEDNGGVHINSGIPNKAFYETAMAIGSDKAGDIWDQALLQLQPQSNFYQAAIATGEAAGKLYGQNSQEQAAVRSAWEMVGISVTQRNYEFPVVGSLTTLDEAVRVARRLQEQNFPYPVQIYLAENDYYAVTLGGYLERQEAARRVQYAKDKGIAKDAYVRYSTAWGENLFK
jgi:hypothetical protein